VSRQRGAITLGDLRELSDRCFEQSSRWSAGASEHVWFVGAGWRHEAEDCGFAPEDLDEEDEEEA